MFKKIFDRGLCVSPHVVARLSMAAVLLLCCTGGLDTTGSSEQDWSEFCMLLEALVSLVLLFVAVVLVVGLFTERGKVSMLRWIGGLVCEAILLGLFLAFLGPIKGPLFSLVAIMFAVLVFLFGMWLLSGEDTSGPPQNPDAGQGTGPHNPN